MRREPTIEREVKRGDIYWINPSPYKGNGDHVQRAGRPGVIVSNNSINDTGNTYEVVMLTTAPKRHVKEHCTIRSSYKTSIALCEQIQTISSEQLGRYVGTCSLQEMETINRCIMISLDLDYEDPQPSETENIFAENKECEELREKLEKMTTRCELLRKLYDDLLEKTINNA